MRAPLGHSAHIPAPVIRVLAALGAVVVFLTVASVIDPGQSTAVDRPSTVPAPTPKQPQPVPSDSLGTLQGTEYSIEIHAAHPETLYTVRDLAGTLILERATAEEIYRHDPEHLDVETLLSNRIGIARPRHDF